MENPFLHSATFEYEGITCVPAGLPPGLPDLRVRDGAGPALKSGWRLTWEDGTALNLIVSLTPPQGVFPALLSLSFTSTYGRAVTAIGAALDETFRCADRAGRTNMACLTELLSAATPNPLLLDLRAGELDSFMPAFALWNWEELQHS